MQYKAIAMLADQRDDVAEELALELAITVHKAQRVVDLAAMRRGDIDSVRAGASGWRAGSPVGCVERLDARCTGSTPTCSPISFSAHPVVAAELAGYGPVPAWPARQRAHDSGSTWRRIVTDPLNGQPIDVGRQRSRPPAVTDRLVRARDRLRPARQLLPATHRLQDEPGWRYELERDTGVLAITTPAGMRYASTPGGRESLRISPSRRPGPSARRRSSTVPAGA